MNLRRANVTKARPLDWPRLDPNHEDTWTDIWGTHTLKKGLLTTQYNDPQPVPMHSKRKHRGW